MDAQMYERKEESETFLIEAGQKAHKEMKKTACEVLSGTAKCASLVVFTRNINTELVVVPGRMAALRGRESSAEVL